MGTRQRAGAGAGEEGENESRLQSCCCSPTAAADAMTGAGRTSLDTAPRGSGKGGGRTGEKSSAAVESLEQSTPTNQYKQCSSAS